MRLDQALLAQNLVRSRAYAQRAIKDGYVTINGKIAVKSSQNIGDSDVLSVNDPNSQWVSRGAQKLLPILDDVIDKIAIDLGASTGGFTQVLLEHGVKHVFAIDVGHGQLNENIEKNERVTSLEGINVKTLSPTTSAHPNWPNFSVITADLSFISLTKALPAALELAPINCKLFALVKPQFELSPAQIGKGGIVKNEADQKRALADVIAFLEHLGWCIEAEMPSPIRGGDGNIEFLLRAKKTGLSTSSSAHKPIPA